MNRRTARGVAAALSVLAAAAAAVVTNVVTARASLVLVIALAFLILLTVASQVWLTVIDSRKADGATEPDAPEPPPAVRPMQLPPPNRQFVGRSAELDELTGLLESSTSNLGAVVISAVFGSAGMGKTTLAVNWAHRVRDRFPDGQLYVNLRGFDALHEPMSPEEAMRSFLDAFEVYPERIPAGFDGQVGLYRKIVAGKRILVVLDNARDVEQIRPLLPNTVTCFVLITSRNQLGGLVVSDGAHAMTLDLLTDQESTGLLVRYLGAARVNSEPSAVSELIKYSGRLPLALAVIAARAVMSTSTTLTDLAMELREEPDLVSALDAGDPHSSVQAVFSWSYRALDPTVARVFRLLGIHPGPDFSCDTVAAMAGETRAAAQDALGALVRSHLLFESPSRRYRMHDLVRVYAGRRAEADEQADVLHETRARMFALYLRTSVAADRWLFPHRNSPPFPPAPPAVTPVELDSLEDANAWFEGEIECLMTASTYARVVHAWDVGWELPWACATYLHRRGRWLDFVATQEGALEAARTDGAPDVVARVQRNLGRAYTLTGRADDARDAFSSSLATYERLEDPTQQALCLDALTWLDGRLENHRAAIGHAGRALVLYRGTGFVAGQARALNYIGWNEARIDELPAAVTHCREALALFEECESLVGQADTHDSLGYAHQRSGELDEAASHYVEAVRLWHVLGDRYNEADVLSRLGDTYSADGNLAAARVSWNQALTIFEEIGYPDTARLNERLAGQGAPATA